DVTETEALHDALAVRDGFLVEVHDVEDRLGGDEGEAAQHLVLVGGQRLATQRPLRLQRRPGPGEQLALLYLRILALLFDRGLDAFEAAVHGLLNRPPQPR